MKAIFLAGLLAVIANPGLSAQSVTVVNVDVVRMGDGEILPNRTVVVADGRIVSIEPSREDSVAREGNWIDGEGLYLAPGRVELGLTVLAKSSFDWSEEVLVRVSTGVTTLGVSGFDSQALDSIRATMPEGHPHPRLVVSNGPSPDSWAPRNRNGIEVGAVADLLLLEQNPLRHSTALHHPLAVMVDGRVHLRAQLAASARSAAQARRNWQMSRVPGQRIGADGAWPRSCVGESLDECFGGDPECGFVHVLNYRGNRLYDCTALSYREGRTEVLLALDRLASVAPSDDWIVGQLVHLALIEEHFDHAWEAAERCRSEPWWCQALRGLVLHSRRQGSAGLVFDSAYAEAARGTPAWSAPRIPEAGDRGLHCEWSDVSYLIEDDDFLADYAAGSCGRRSDFESRYWWLADPLWSEPGNVRRDEHIARNVHARLRDDFLRYFSASGKSTQSGQLNHAHCTVSFENLTWRLGGGDWCESSHRDLVAIGFPNSWTGVPYTMDPGYEIGADGILRNPEPGSNCRHIGNQFMCNNYARPQIREGFLNGGYSFVPDHARYDTPETSTAEDWAPKWNEGHERMITRETWYGLDHQTAVLRRGDELRILAAARFPTLLPSLDSLEGFLAVGRARDQHVDVTPAELDRGTGTMRASVTLPEDGWIVSVEALAPEVRGRARLGAPPPTLVDGFGISRPVLMPADFDPAVDDVLTAMLPSRAVPAGGTVGLYLELYGAEAGQTAQMALTYDPGEREPSFFGRIAGVFGFGGDDGGPVRVEWTEQLEEVEDGIGRVFVASDLGDFEDAELVLTFTASVDGRTATTSAVLRPRR